MTGFDIDKARSYFDFDEQTVYLDNASRGPLPLPSLQAYDRYLSGWRKMKRDLDIESFATIEELRSQLAAMIKTDSSRIALSSNTSFGLNVVASGIKWNRGDKVVLSEDEFPANVYPWLRLRSLGVEIKFVKTRDGFIDEAALISAADKDTRVISVSWVQFNNGHRCNLREIGEYCRNRDILFCVDGIQGMGVIPIDVPSLNIDLFTCGCQKWMLGPCGTGFFYLSEKAESFIEPPLSGWLSVNWGGDFTKLRRYDLPVRRGPSQYELGTYPYQDLTALNQSVRILRSFGQERIWKYVSSLSEKLASLLSENPKCRLLSPSAPSERSAIVAFTTEDPKALYQRLISEGFVLSYREGALRISPHFYSTFADICKLIDHL